MNSDGLKQIKRNMDEMLLSRIRETVDLFEEATGFRPNFIHIVMNDVATDDGKTQPEITEVITTVEI